jgi:ribosomal protein L19
MSTTASTPFPLGVFVGNANSGDPSAEATFDTEVQSFDSLMGTTPSFMNAYIDTTMTPSQWLSDLQWSAAQAEASPSWKGVTPVIGLPMGSTNADAPSTQQILENYADGSYDSMLQGMVQAWASDGFMTQYWRPGVEMNLSSTPGFVGSDTSLQALWVSAFQHIYTVLHAAAAADGVTLKVVWNPGTANGSDAGNPTQTMWPGAQYVDVVGADVYSDAYPYGNHDAMYDWDKSGQMINSPNPVYDTSFQQWASDPINLEHYYTDPASDQYTLDGSGGAALSLQNIIDFAKAQGKPIAICEAGAGSTGDGAGVSDNPTFVQWLSSTLESSGVTVDFVNIWDSDGGGTYAFSNSGDDKPQEAAAWAKYFGAQATSTTPITLTPATENVATSNTASVHPFTGVVITDANSDQTETAIVTLSAAANGTLVDPNAATDGSTSATGIWSVSGTAAQVSAALDGLEFTPTANQVAAGVAVTTTVSVALEDTAGQQASATSTVTAKQAGTQHAASPADTKVIGTAGTIYDTSGNAWTITSGQQIAENGTVVPSSANVTTLFWTGTALDQLNSSGQWWTQPLSGSAGTELSGAPTGYAAPVTPITITPASEAVTTDPVAIKPFTGVVITDANAGQTETATITLSTTANGTLSDPNAATDGSKVANGVLTVSGSATAVATDLDGLAFTPSSSPLVSTVTTTVTATIKDTAGETASATSKITATPPASSANTQITGTKGTIYDTSGNAWTITSGQQIAENGTVVSSSANVTTLFWTGTALDQLNTQGQWWTQPLSGTAGTELSSAPVGYVPPTTPITITPATSAVSTTDAASVKPLTGVVITDGNASQTETAKVTLSTAANGTLSDPNAAIYGSKVTAGVLTVSGSAAAVATALDGLVFKPTDHEVAPKGVVTTTVTAAITDTAGQTASAKSTITATAAATPITVTPATGAVTTTDTTSVKPFAGVAIADANAGQTETATVALSTAANGTLSDPNAATDGSTVASGVLTVSGSAAAVGTALDGLVFKPTAKQVAAGSAVTTKVTASIRDTAGETASSTSTVTATQVANTTPTVDTLQLNISEDAWEGNAQFTVAVDGKQVGGDYTASTLHSSGDAGAVVLTGDWGSGVSNVQVSFINDAYSGTAQTDRNLYVSSISENGATYAGTTASLFSDGTTSFAVGGTTPTASAPTDTVTLNLSEEAWQGDAQFVLYIDGKAVTAPQAVTASHAANATQTFAFTGDLGAGSHTVGVDFVNDAYGGSSTEDRNLYINGVTVNGSDVFSGVKAQDSNGTSLFTFTTAS